LVNSRERSFAAALFNMLGGGGDWVEQSPEKKVLRKVEGAEEVPRRLGGGRGSKSALLFLGRIRTKCLILAG
jgi:hypothetical protein